MAGVGYRVTVDASDGSHPDHRRLRVRSQLVRAHPCPRGRHRPLRLRARRRTPVLRSLAGLARRGPGTGAGDHGRPLTGRGSSTAVLEDDIETLCTVPGVGRKTAARLLIELKSRLDLPDLSLESGGAAMSAQGQGDRASRTSRAEARAALSELGDAARGDPRCARRATRRCRRGRDASTPFARWRAGEPSGPSRGPGRRAEGARRPTAPGPTTRASFDPTAS